MVSFRVELVMPILRLLGVFLPLRLVEKEASSISVLPSASCAPMRISLVIEFSTEFVTVFPHRKFGTNSSELERLG